MGQQPNQEITEAEKPRATPETPPARSWHPTKPGLITSPDQVPKGGRFGAAGPDAGWALRLLSLSELPDDDSNLRGVLAGLMTARAAALGRAPIKEDLEVALVLCGYGFEAPPEVVATRERWKAAVPHEARPGQTAVAETDKELIVNKPEQVRWALTRAERPQGEPGALS
jgi:hypothetical protein